MQTASMRLFGRIARGLLYAACIAVIILGWFMTDHASAGPGHSFVRLAVIMAAGLALVVWGIEGGAFRISLPAAGMLAFGLVMLIAAAGERTLFTGRETAQGYMLAACFMVSASFAARSDRFRWAFLAAVLAGGTAVALYGIDQYFFQFDRLIERLQGQDGWFDGMREVHRRAFWARVKSREVFASFVHPNTFGACMGGLLVLWSGFTVDLFRRGRDLPYLRRILPAALVGGILAAAGLFLSRSKGAAAVTLAALVFLFVIAGRVRTRWKIAAVAGVLIAAVVLTIATPLLDASIAVRRGYWAGAWGMIGDHGLEGVGVGRFGDWYTRYKGPTATEVQNPHNIFLGLWSESGLISMLLFAGTWGLYLAGRPRCRRPLPLLTEPPLRPGAVFIFILALMCGLGCLFMVWHECAWLTIGLMILTFAIGALGFLRLQSEHYAPFVVTGHAVRALVFLFVCHSLIDYDLAVPSVLLLACAAAAVSSTEVRGLELPDKSRRFIIPAAMGFLVWIYLGWGLADLDCQTRAYEISALFNGPRTGLAAGLDLCAEAERTYPRMDRFPELEVELCRRLGGPFSRRMREAQLRLAELRGVDAAAWSHLGEMLAAAGDHQQALASHRRSCEFYPGNPRYLMFLAQSSTAVGDRAAAVSSARQALELDRQAADFNVKLNPAERETLLRLTVTGE